MAALLFVPSFCVYRTNDPPPLFESSPMPLPGMRPWREYPDVMPQYRSPFRLLRFCGREKRETSPGPWQRPHTPAPRRHAGPAARGQRTQTCAGQVEGHTRQFRRSRVSTACVRSGHRQHRAGDRGPSPLCCICTQRDTSQERQISGHKGTTPQSPYPPMVCGNGQRPETHGVAGNRAETELSASGRTAPIFRILRR